MYGRRSEAHTSNVAVKGRMLDDGWQAIIQCSDRSDANRSAARGVVSNERTLLDRRAEGSVRVDGTARARRCVVDERRVGDRGCDDRRAAEVVGASESQRTVEQRRVVAERTIRDDCQLLMYKHYGTAVAVDMVVVERALGERQ